jgi:hypothetical protein
MASPPENSEVARSPVENMIQTAKIDIARTAEAIVAADTVALGSTDIERAGLASQCFVLRFEVESSQLLRGHWSETKQARRA